jgi:alpha-tubulin suppressor-like RCC1 family protein
VLQETGVRFVQISAGYQLTCAVSDGGDVWCWGSNTFGQLGDRGIANQSSPVRTVRPPGVTFSRVSAGTYQHACAVDTTGQTWCWGRNQYGQLGDGTYVNSSEPVAVRQARVDPGGE